MHTFCVYCFGGGRVIFGIFFRAGGGAYSLFFFLYGEGAGFIFHNSEHSFLHIIYLKRTFRLKLSLRTWPS